MSKVFGQFLIGYIGQANDNGFVPVSLIAAETSAQARRLVRADGEIGRWKGYIAEDAVPDTINMKQAYEVEGELVMERVPWESYNQQTRKTKITYIENPYIYVSGLRLSGTGSAAAAPAAVASTGGVFDDVPSAAEFAAGGSGGGSGKRGK